MKTLWLMLLYFLGFRDNFIQTNVKFKDMPQCGRGLGMLVQSDGKYHPARLISWQYKKFLNCDTEKSVICWVPKQSLVFWRIIKFIDKGEQA